MYNVTLINLSADARSVSEFAHVEQRDVGNDDLRERLRNFCALDPLENVGADAEIRVQVRHEKYLIRTEQGKLILYDVNRRELPAQRLTAAEAMNELDGTATMARDRAITLARAAAAPKETAPVLPVVAPAPVANRLRVVAMTIVAGGLLGGILYLAAPFTDDSTPAGFAPVEPAERDAMHAALTGVYLTGTEPGHHGIVVAAPGGLKLFELGVVEAPRVIYASYTPGRVEQKLFLATDQPGGLIEVAENGALVYCGEVYRRIP